jgi:hypothetical protein
VNYRSTDANAPVSCAVFRVEEDEAEHSYTLFVLGFQDGRLVLYRLFLPRSSRHRNHRYSHHAQSFQLQPVRIAAIGKLHKAAMGGIAAAEFLPGYKSRIVSIGHDGRCRLVDFEGGGKVLRT